MPRIPVVENIMHANEVLAGELRQRLDAAGVYGINLMASPGAGKTSFITGTVNRIKDKINIGYVDGDIETVIDAERIAKLGLPVVQINTGGNCHLDANMLNPALDELPLETLDLMLVENVGNLVCPASFDLGQHRNVALLSVPEGDDKPSKYPVMFRAADLVAITKVDLLPVLDDFSVERARSNVRALANAAPLLELSTRRQDSLGAWLDWLQQQVAEHRSRCARGESLRPRVQPDGAVLHGLATSG